ncbi:MAG: VWA domain-containing protein, partial [Candidatus Woesearchaeota archaeon]|nr:VWA domain-containing protein [Candidatus Woesearchaeota archaeon]
RVVILITDGQSNVGAEVKEGIEHANNANTVIHTIGIGSEQGGSFIRTELISMLDEESLKLIAESTGGKYFRASDNQAILNAYENIADMSSQKLSIRLSAALISIAVIFIFIEWTLLNTKYRTLP